MNWAQLKDPVSHMCLAGAMVASRSLTQEAVDSSPFTVTNIEFSENIWEKLHCFVTTVTRKWSMSF